MTRLGILVLLIGSAVAAPGGALEPISEASFAATLSQARLDLVAQAGGFRAAGEDGSQAKCAQVVADAATIVDEDALYECRDFYWHHADYDIGWNKMIKLTYRMIDLDPRNAELYGDCAWLLWSKWVRWSQNPQDPAGMPDGAKRKAESMRVFEDGLARTHRDFNILVAYAKHATGFLQDWPKGIELWTEVNARAADDKMRIRARLSLGECYRKLGQAEPAKRWFKAVLEIDPQNRSALTYLRELEGR